MDANPYFHRSWPRQPYVLISATPVFKAGVNAFDAHTLPDTVGVKNLPAKKRLVIRVYLYRRSINERIGSNQMTAFGNHRERSAWLFFIATLFLSGLFTFANLSEFVTVGVLKQTSGYPFGDEGPVPWYYSSAELYASVNLIFGGLFLLAFSIGVWSFMKARKNILLISFRVSLLLIVLQLLTGQPG